MDKIYKTIRTCGVIVALSAGSMQAQCNSATYVTAANNCGIDYISNVTFATINRNSTCDPLAVYATPNPTVYQGFTYSISVTTGGDTEGARAWIDFNQDGVFTNAAPELILGPLYLGTNPATYTAMVTIPVTALVGGTRLRVRCNYAGSPVDATTAQTWGETEDFCIYIATPPPCATTPGTNSIISPTAAVCPGAAVLLGLTNSYTNSAITYTWQASTTGTNGVFTAVPGGTNTTLTTTLSTNTWFQTIITCQTTSGAITTSANIVNVMPTTTNTVPYFEGFEGISGTNKLPNCSWTLTNVNSSAFTYSVPQNGQNRIPHTGNAFASFYYSPVTTSNFYSNGIWFDAGVTYSANIWYTTDSYGYNTWELGLNYGPNQNQTGTVSIVSAKPAISGAYKLLSNTFQVTTSGLYYLNIQGKSNGTCCGYNLSWDDLEIMIPCALNSPTVGLSTSNTTICAGQQVVLTATGADAYVWNTGATTPAITEMPGTPNVYNYNVVGTNTLSGCSMSQSQQVLVNPSPMMGIIATPATACAGKPVTLSAYGADTYTWSSTGNGQSTVVNPTGPTSYTVLGTNIYNCSGQAVQQVNVNAIPVVAIVPTASNICAGETVTLTGNGAGATGTYVWKANTAYIAANPVPVSPHTSTSYTLEGTDANGCVGSAFFSLGVDPCVGITEASLGNVSAYPNPTSGQFTIEMNDNSSKSVMVTDMMGRVISSTTTSNTKVNIDLGTAANGVYYVKVKSGNTLEIVKVVKQ